MFLTVEAEKAKLRWSINISTKFHNSPQGEKLASIKRSNRFLNRTKSSQKTVLAGKKFFYDWFSFSPGRWWVNNLTSSSLIEPAIQRSGIGNSRSQLRLHALLGTWSAFGYLLDMELIKHIMLIYLPWNCFDENRELEAPSRLIRNYSRNWNFYHELASESFFYNEADCLGWQLMGKFTGTV